MNLKHLRLKKGEDHRIAQGHLWIFSNEIDTKTTPLKSFTSGEEVLIEAHNKNLLGIGYVNPHSLIAARLVSRDPSERLTVEFFINRIRAALEVREDLFSEPYYRLVFSEADALPGLVIDRFDNDLVVQLNTAGMEQKKEIIVDALKQIFPRLHSILLRNDSAIRTQEGLETYIRPIFGTPPNEIELVENKVRFLSPLAEGQKTGWFYDHRMTRARLKDYVQNRSVLDVFSYLGGFGIEAAVFGAKQVTCIDSSTLACDYIAKNAALNQVQEKVHIICEDAFVAMKALLSQNKSFAVIILDPPAFVKRAKDRKEGLIAYQRINEMALKLLSRGGILVSCSCSMQVSMEDMINIVERAAYRTQNQIQLLERGHQGPDHPVHVSIPETDYLKALFIRKI